MAQRLLAKMRCRYCCCCLSPCRGSLPAGALTAFKAVGLERLLTIVVGHATFCVVVVFNNVIARFRRTSWSMVEASMDLGATGWQTFRYVVLPNLGSALLAGNAGIRSVV